MKKIRLRLFGVLLGVLIGLSFSSNGFADCGEDHGEPKKEVKKEEPKKEKKVEKKKEKKKETTVEREKPKKKKEAKKDKPPRPRWHHQPLFYEDPYAEFWRNIIGLAEELGPEAGQALIDSASDMLRRMHKPDSDPDDWGEDIVEFPYDEKANNKFKDRKNKYKKKKPPEETNPDDWGEAEEIL